MNVVGDWRWSRMIEERAEEWEKRRGGRRKRRGVERGERGKGCWGEVWVMPNSHWAITCDYMR